MICLISRARLSSIEEVTRSEMYSARQPRATQARARVAWSIVGAMAI